MIRKIKTLIIVFGLIVASSCTLNLLEDPNNVSLTTADPDFLMNRIQGDFAGLQQTASNFGMQVTRIRNVGGSTYETAYTSQSFDGMWNTSYAALLQDIEVLIPKAEGLNLFNHAGIARVIKAQVLMLLVDYFGDVPYTEALDPTNFNPNADPGAAIYTEALNTLDAALVSFGQASLSNPPDHSFGSTSSTFASTAPWIRTVNSLKLKLFLSRRLVDAAGSTAGINALLVTPNLISTAGDNYTWKYGRNLSDPDSRHPFFTDQYIVGSGAYQSNFFMYQITEAMKGGSSSPTAVPRDGAEAPDPRARYYFYRQVVANPIEVNEIRCIFELPPNHYPAGMPWCLPGTRGYWGRDHIDNQGIPPDGLKRTAWGVYPAGGKFDNGTTGAPIAVNNQLLGNQGAGIQPIMMRSFVDFMLAEAALTLPGFVGNTPAFYLTSAITKSMDDVRSISLGSLESAAISTFHSTAAFDALRIAYITQVNAEYLAAATNADRMRIIAREYWKAAFGNGVEAYNLYRRTGFPDNMQPGLFASFGQFYRSFTYPSAYVNRNINALPKPGPTVQVFWDNNPAGFIN